MIKKLDKKDYDILRIMTLKGTTNAKIVSQETKISSRTIRNRIAKYKLNNIFSTAILINPEFFNYNIKVDFFIKRNPEIKSKKIVSMLLKEYKHNIIYIGHHWDERGEMLIQMIFKQTREIMKFKNFLDNSKLVIEYKMIIVPLVERDTYEWMPDQNNFKLTDKDIEDLNNRRKQEESKKITTP